MTKIIIAGSRTFCDYNMLAKFADDTLQILPSTSGIEIVSGCARGTDTLAIAYAEARGYGIKKFPADWQKHGKSAGVLRNMEMAKYADALIAFWDGKSKGTQHMIMLGFKQGLKTFVCNTSQ